MLWRTSPIGTELEGVVVALAARGPGPAGRRSTGLLTDTASTSTLIALAAAREAAGLDASARGLAGRDDVRAGPRLRLGGGPQLHREGVHDAGPRPRGAGQDPGQRPLRAGARGPRGGDRRGPGRGPAARSPSWPPSAPPRPPPSIPVAAVADIAEREGLWLHVDSAYAGVVALLPDRRGAVRRLGARRLDRRQPAQVAVHAARRLAAALAADGPAARGVQPRARVPAHARPREPRPRLHRVPAAAGPPDARPQAVDAAALVRDGRAPPPDRVPPGPGRARSPPGSTRTRTGSAWRRRRSRPSASATGRARLVGREDEPGTSTPGWTRPTRR